MALVLARELFELGREAVAHRRLHLLDRRVAPARKRLRLTHRREHAVVGAPPPPLVELRSAGGAGVATR